MTKRSFVIGVAGIPGSGKTTLMKLLLRDYTQAQAVYYDRYHPGMTDAQIGQWLARSGDPNELALSDLVRELRSRTEISMHGQGQPLVFFETTFGRAHRATGSFIDFLVWIDTPLDVALARASLVFIDSVERQKVPDAASDFIKWLKVYMRDYPLLRRMYLAMNGEISSTADLIVDGTLATETSLDIVKSAIAKRGVEA